MNFGNLAKAVIPVIVGVFLAGLLQNALRSNRIVKDAINGFDA